MNPIILPPAMGKIVGQTGFFSLGEATSLGEGKLWIQTCETPLKKLTLCHILPERRGLGKYDEGVLYILQSSCITGASPSDCLASYPGNLLRESYPSVEMQLVYSAAPTDWAKHSLWQAARDIGFYMKIKQGSSCVLNKMEQSSHEIASLWNW